MAHSEHNATNCDVGWTPLAQFVFRGDEAVEGAAFKKAKSFGGDHHRTFT